MQLLVCSASRGWAPTSCLDAVDGLRDLGGGPQEKGCPEHHRTVAPHGTVGPACSAAAASLTDPARLGGVYHV